MSSVLPDTAWSRQRLTRTLAGLVVLALVLLVGLGSAIYQATTSTGQQENSTTPTAVHIQKLSSGAPLRDAIAAAPMLSVPPASSRGGTPAADPSGTIVIPAAGRTGPAEIATGFPQTPQGAAGQLAAIETTVLQSMSVDNARTVYASWSAPGAPPVAQWRMITNIQAFRQAGSGGQVDDAGDAIVATPVAAQVKGTDGPQWTVACVLLRVTARLATTAQIAYGHCERMQWLTTGDVGRWVIAPGLAPSRAPSTWPGTDLAKQAGWLTWTSSAGE